MPDLREALEQKHISEPVQRVVLAAAERTGCQPLDRSRDGNSVPCVAQQGTQVALYPMKHRIAIAMDPEKAEGWGAPLSARLERKTRRTTYLHLVKQQLADPAVAELAVEAAVASLELCGQRPQGEAGDEGAPALRDFGSCRVHGYPFNAHGSCPTCEGEF